MAWNGIEENCFGPENEINVLFRISDIFATHAV